MPGLRKRPKAARTPDLRGYLRRELAQKANALEERCSSPGHFALMAWAVGLDRIDVIDRGEPVEVRGYEIREKLAAVALNGLYVIDEHGQTHPSDAGNESLGDSD